MIDIAQSHAFTSAGTMAYKQNNYNYGISETVYDDIYL